MGDLVPARFFKIMEEEAKKLAEKEGNEINPTNIVVDDIDRQYTYSLASLDSVIGLASRFHESLSKRVKGQMTDVRRAMDEKEGRDNACRIVFHSVLGAVAVVAFNPKNQKNRSCLPPTWTRDELGKRSAIERFFGRVFLFFHLQRPPLTGWSEIASQVALTYAASVIVGLAAQQAG